VCVGGGEGRRGLVIDGGERRVQAGGGRNTHERLLRQRHAERVATRPETSLSSSPQVSSVLFGQILHGQLQSAVDPGFLRGFLVCSQRLSPAG